MNLKFIIKVYDDLNYNFNSKYKCSKKDKLLKQENIIKIK